jgi:hypothetical protein
MSRGADAITDAADGRNDVDGQEQARALDEPFLDGLFETGI